MSEITTFPPVSPKDILEAKKKLKAKPDSNMMAIKLDYGTFLLLPYQAGLNLLAALEHAEIMESRYGSRPTIKPFDKDRFETQTWSAQEILRTRLAQLLDVSPSDLPESVLT
jgi:hypothetical protein